MIPTCGIDHAVLHVADAARSSAFYRDVLGFSLFEQAGNQRVFLRSGDCQLGLFQAADPRAIVPYAELDHLALRVVDLDEDRVKQALRQHAVELRPRPEGLGCLSSKWTGVYLRDPDGHTLQLLPAGQWPQVMVR